MTTTYHAPTPISAVPQVCIPLEIAKRIDAVCLPTNPNKCRNWSPELRAVALEFRRLVRDAAVRNGVSQ